MHLQHLVPSILDESEDGNCSFNFKQVKQLAKSIKMNTQHLCVESNLELASGWMVAAVAQKLSAGKC